MAKKEEKTFEANLASLKRGCIILGVLQAFSVISAFKGLAAGTGSALSLVISLVLLGMLYYIYKYTKERNPLGPKLEKIYGILLLIDGIIMCLTIVGIIIGLIFIVLALGILDEAKYFKAELEENTVITNEEDNVNKDL